MKQHVHSVQGILTVAFLFFLGLSAGYTLSGRWAKWHLLYWAKASWAQVQPPVELRHKKPVQVDMLRQALHIQATLNNQCYLGEDSNLLITSILGIDLPISYIQ